MCCDTVQSHRQITVYRRNVLLSSSGVICILDCTVSQPRRPQFEQSQPWKPQKVTSNYCLCFHIYIQGIRKGVTGFNERTYVNEQKSPSRHMPRTQYIMKYRLCSCYLYSGCSMWFPCNSAQLPALHRTQMRTLSKIPDFTRIPSQAFSTCPVIPLNH